MSTNGGIVESFLESEFDAEVRRWKAIHEGASNENRRLSDKPAFDAFILAVQAVLTKKTHETSSETPTLKHSHGRGILSKNGTSQVKFYLHAGYLIVKADRIFCPPSIKLPTTIVVPYKLGVPGQILGWYQFLFQQATFNELQVANQLIELTG